MPSTLLLTRTELRRAVDVPALTAEMHQAMASHQPGRAERVRSGVSDTVTTMVLVPGLAPGVPAYTVKVHAKNPRRRPALTGFLCLHDLHSGDLLAVLDSGWLTAVRTGVGAALGTHVLAGSDAREIGVIGAGEQGRAQLTALAALRRPSSLHVYDSDAAATAAFVEWASVAMGLAAHVHDGTAEVAAACDVVLVATWSRSPLLAAGDVRAGGHVTSLGADEPGKAELHPDLLAAALVVTDDQELAARVLARTDTSLSRVLRGQHPGRTTDEQITVYSPVGLPLQDCVIAWHAYRSAVQQGLGTPIDLET